MSFSSTTCSAKRRGWGDGVWHEYHTWFTVDPFLRKDMWLSILHYTQIGNVVWIASLAKWMARQHLAGWKQVAAFCAAASLKSSIADLDQLFSPNQTKTTSLLLWARIRNCDCMFWDVGALRHCHDCSLLSSLLCCLFRVLTCVLWVFSHLLSSVLCPRAFIYGYIYKSSEMYLFKYQNEFVKNLKSGKVAGTDTAAHSSTDRFGGRGSRRYQDLWPICDRFCVKQTSQRRSILVSSIGPCAIPICTARISFPWPMVSDTPTFFTMFTWRSVPTS